MSSCRGVLGAFGEAVGADLTLLAMLHERELDDGLIRSLRAHDFEGSFAITFEDGAARQAEQIFATAIDGLPPAAGEAFDELNADYCAIYLHHGYRASPYASVWRNEEHLMYQEAMFAVRSAYASLGVAVPDWRRRADDHLAYLMRFVAILLCRGDAESLHAAARFLDDHLLVWLEGFASAVAGRCRTMFYAALAMFTAAYCEELRRVLEYALDEPRRRPTLVLRACRAADDLPAPTSCGSRLAGPTW